VKPVGGVSDVFVVAYDVVFGNINWAKQFGTVHDDKLARGGGITADNEGNVIIMGSTRGPLQRYRATEPNRNLQAERLASDIFVMSLSAENGDFINAPYSSEDSSKGASFIAANAHGISPGGIAGIVVTSVIFLCSVIILICRRGRHKKKSSGVAERMWDRSYEDDFSFDQTRGGYKDSLRIVRGGLQHDDWDDGADRISKSASWMKNNPYSKRKSDENSTFLRSLRDEANLTMNKMFKEPKGNATDPRLDDGASIKSLLTHYREVRKGKLVDGDGRKAAADTGSNEPKKTDFRSNPPPPPPRRDDLSRRSTISGESADGLTEFTIV
jgi:hypothetical protein